MSTAPAPIASHPPTAPVIPAAERNNNFNFLRLLFASLVLVSHGVEIVDGDRHREPLTYLFGTHSLGELAVDGFFLLSGYLIIRSWQHKPVLKDFLLKRIRRIYPGYLVAFGLCVCVLAPLGAASVSGYLAELSFPSLLKQAALLQMPATPPIFGGRPYPIINGAMWTITFEFRCYLLVALIGLLGASRQQVIWGTLFLVSLGLTLLPAVLPSAVTSLHLASHPIARLLPYFGAGACFHLFRRHIVYKGTYAAIAAIIVVASLFRFGLSALALPTFGGYCLFWMAYAHLPFLRYFTRSHDISYGVYLYGWPIQKLMTWYFPSISPWALLFPMFLLSLLAGYASWQLIESRFLQRRRLAIG